MTKFSFIAINEVPYGVAMRFRKQWWLRAGIGLIKNVNTEKFLHTDSSNNYIAAVMTILIPKDKVNYIEKTFAVNNLNN